MRDNEIEYAMLVHDDGLSAWMIGGRPMAHPNRVPTDLANSAISHTHPGRCRLSPDAQHGTRLHSGHRARGIFKRW